MNLCGIQTTIGETELVELDQWASHLRTSRSGAMRVAIRYALENTDVVAAWLVGAEERAQAESQRIADQWARA